MIQLKPIIRNLKKLYFRLSRYQLMFVSILAGLILTSTLLSFKVNSFEAFLYDFRMRNHGQIKTPLHSVLVSFNDTSYEKTGEPSLDHYTKLLTSLKTSEAKAIALVVDFNEILNQDSNHKLQIQEFLKAAQSLQSQGIRVYIGTDFDVTGEVVPVYPISTLPHFIAFIHKDGSVFSEDKVTRRALYSINDSKSLHTQLAEDLLSTPSQHTARGIYSVPEIDARYFLIHYTGATQDSRQPFPHVNAADVILNKIPTELFKEKVIFIGSQSKNNSHDYVYTPFSRENFENSKLTIHGNILETLVQNNALILSSQKFDWMLTFLLTTFIVWLVFRTTPLRGVVGTFGLMVAFITIAILAFRFFNFSFNMSHPILGIFFAYYVFVPYRLIMEFTKRSEIQKKHQILMQVDELKRNFMSLITHDLKTPVARIQGMAEILKRAHADTQTVNTIFESTDELNRFITSILELATVESNQIKPNKISKDINRIIEDCVKKFEFQARAKHLSIITHLDPMFPFHFDINLIGKVISNLLDNAIKYSPSYAHITLSSGESLEHPGYAEIKIKDTGYGMGAETLENLFLKFYRPKNDHNLKNKGYGLGLYLSRYFVSLHHGSLSATSELGKGSEFTLLLPMEENLKLKFFKTSQKLHTTQGGLYV